MNSGRPLRLIFATTLMLGGLAMVPIVAAVSVTEDFEDDPTFAVPTSTWYTVGNAGSSNAYVVDNPTPANTWLDDQVFEQQASSSRAYFQFSDGDVCGNGQNTIRMAFRANIPGAQSHYIGLATGQTAFNLNTANPALGILYSSTGAVTTFANSNTVDDTPVTMPGLTLVNGDWYNLTFSFGQCSGNLVTTIVDSLGAATQVSNSWATGTTTGLDVLTTGGASGAEADDVQFLDNLFVDDGTTLAAGARFCADPFLTDATGTGDTPNYGYTYRRGGTYFTDNFGNAGTISMQDGFGFSGDNTEATWDYLAKGLTVSTKAMHVVGQIEAAADGTSSVFRYVFQTVTSTDPGAGSKGNGLNSGNFADHAEVQFLEAGSHWQITLWYVTGGGARTQVGPAVNHGNPNNPTVYNFYLSTLPSTGPFMAVTDLNGASIASSNGTSTLNGNAFRTAFSGDPIWAQWFIGYGTGVIAGINTGIDANTALNNNEDGSHNSTCLYDDYGTAVVTGSAGSSPVDGVPGEIVDETPDENPAHIDFGSQGANFLAGVLLLVGMVFMGVEKGAGNVAIAIIFFVALALAYAVGWIPLGFLILLMVIAIAALWFMPGMGGGRAEREF